MQEGIRMTAGEKEIEKIPLPPTKITVEVEGNVCSFTIEGIANEILVKDILTECIKGTPELKGKKKSDGLMMLLKNMLKGFVKQKMKLW